MKLQKLATSATKSFQDFKTMDILYCHRRVISRMHLFYVVSKMWPKSHHMHVRFCPWTLVEAQPLETKISIHPTPPYLGCTVKTLDGSGTNVSVTLWNYVVAGESRTSVNWAFVTRQLAPDFLLLCDLIVCFVIWRCSHVLPAEQVINPWRPLLPYRYRYKASCARPG